MGKGWVEKYADKIKDEVKCITVNSTAVTLSLGEEMPEQVR